jgi:hypothetical protein
MTEISNKNILTCYLDLPNILNTQTMVSSILEFLSHVCILIRILDQFQLFKRLE